MVVLSCRVYRIRTVTCLGTRPALIRSCLTVGRKSGGGNTAQLSRQRFSAVPRASHACTPSAASRAQRRSSRNADPSSTMRGGRTAAAGDPGRISSGPKVKPSPQVRLASKNEMMDGRPAVVRLLSGGVIVRRRFVHHHGAGRVVWRSTGRSGGDVSASATRRRANCRIVPDLESPAP